MDKRKILTNGTVSLVAFFALLLGAVSRGGSNIFVARGDYEPYSIVLETNKNKIGEGAFSPTATHSGNGFATTELGNQVAFEYNELYNPINYWQTIKAGGYITNTQPIMGMSSISLTKSGTTGNFGVYWSNTKTFTSERYVQFDTSSPLNVTTDFAGYKIEKLVEKELPALVLDQFKKELYFKSKINPAIFDTMTLDDLVNWVKEYKYKTSGNFKIGKFRERLRQEGVNKKTITKFEKEIPKLEEFIHLNLNE